MTRVTIRHDKGGGYVSLVTESAQEIGEAIGRAFKPVKGMDDVPPYVCLTSQHGYGMTVQVSEIAKIEPVPLVPLPNPKKSWWGL